MPTRIDWCDETVNPLGHGCYGPGGTAENPKRCSYCYAQKIAKRAMRGCDLCRQFVPHTHFEQLEKLAKWKKPRNIFIESMGDLFHDAIPDEWIHRVFDACERAPQHRYLFLTKNPKRYEKVLDQYFPPNMYFGWSQDGPMGDAMRHTTHHSIQSFVSLEPLHRPFETFNVCSVDWVIIGAETGNRKGKVIPEKSWIDDIVRECRNNDVPVFMKESLRSLMGDDFKQEFPWEVKNT